MIEYEVNAKFAKDVEAVLGNNSFTEFNPLREQEVQILTEICTRTDKEGEHVECKGNPIVCKKIPTQYAVLIGKKAHYLMVGDYYFWTHASDTQKDAAIHRALSSIKVDKDKKGKIRLGRQPPEIQEYRATVARFGAWNEPLVDMKEALKTSAKLFAEKQKP